MKKILLILVLLFDSPVQTVHAQYFNGNNSTYYLPLIAVGGGVSYAANGVTVVDGYTTDITGTNLKSAFTNVGFEFVDQKGSRLQVKLKLPMDDVLLDSMGITLTLNGKSSRQFSITLPNPSVVVGWARVTVPQTPIGQVVNPPTGDDSAQVSSQYSFRVGGVVAGQATVPAVKTTMEGVFFGQLDQNADTGIAMANPNEGRASVVFTCHDVFGNIVTAFTETVEPWQHFSKFLSELNRSLGSHQGQCRFNSSQPVAVTVFRTTTIGSFNFSTVPVYPL